MADLKITGLHKYYGTVHAVKGIDLEIPAGEFTVLVGQSGCGKSTLLRTIAGLEDADQGSIEIGGHEVTHMLPRDRDIAMVFQNYALYPYMTVFDNIAFGLRARKTQKAEIEPKVRRAAQMLAIEPFLARFPRQLSGGQLQRVAIGRAVVRNARLYLFDEPLSNLDAKLRVQTRAEITKLQQQLGTTSVYVTHDQIEAMTMGHRITVLRDGKIQQGGTPREVYENPANAFVAQFIGTPPMNLIKATVNGNSLQTSSFALPLRLPLAQGRNVIAGIRPEHITRGTSLNATVDLVEPIGHESIVYANAGTEKLVAIFEPHDAPRTGEVVSLTVDAERIHLFDAATEIALS